MSAQRELSEKVTSRHWAQYLFPYCVQIFNFFFFFNGSCFFFCSYFEGKCEIDIFDTSLLAWVFKGDWNNALKRQIILSYPHFTYYPILSPPPFLLSCLSLLPVLLKSAAGISSLSGPFHLGYSLQLLNSQNNSTRARMTLLKKLSQKKGTIRSSWRMMFTRHNVFHLERKEIT